MDVPLYHTYSNAFLFCLLGIGLLCLMLVLLFDGIRIAYSSCILSEETFEKLKLQKPSHRDALIRLLRKPEAVHRSLFFFQNLFVVLAAFSVSCAVYSASSDLRIISLAALLTIVVLTIATSLIERFAHNRALSILRSTVRLTQGLVAFGQFVFRIPDDAKTSATDGETFSVEELGQALEMQEDEEDKTILDSVLHFGEKTVEDVMIPRVDVVCIDHESNFDKVMQCVVENNYSRLPVTIAPQNKICGVLYVKDLLPYRSEAADFKWQDLIRPAFFVPESKRIDDLLREFQRKKVHVAVVVDEYGDASGLVTMEDILEEIVGEINDEYDEDVRQFVRLDDHTYVFEGKTPIEDFFSAIALPQEDFAANIGEAETLAGFVLELFNEMPTKHQQTSCRNLRFEVLALDRRRISKVKVTVG